MRHVIIGNGVAGVHAAETIRHLDPQASITIIAGEIFPPYCRPMISLVLEGSVQPKQLPIRAPDFYSRLDIEPMTGTRVSEIDVDNREVRTSRNDRVAYDRLLIASGAEPRPLNVPGTELRNIFFMRSEGHVNGMIEALENARHVLILGGGLVGFKAAYGFLHRGVEVTMLIKSAYPLSMQVDPEAGGMVLDELVRHGLHVRVGVEVTAFEGIASVERALLSDGSTLPCDIAVIGKGVFPATSFIPTDRIHKDLGLLVNEHLETDVPDVFAAGDVAEYFDVARDRRWVNAIWPVAVEQGRIAGFNMAGRPVTYLGSLGRNVIRVFDLDVLSAGVVEPPEEDGCEVMVHRDLNRRFYRKLVFRQDRLVGMVLVNRIEQGGVLVSLIQQQRPILKDKERLLNPRFNVAQLTL